MTPNQISIIKWNSGEFLYKQQLGAHYKLQNIQVSDKIRQKFYYKRILSRVTAHYLVLLGYTITSATISYITHSCYCGSTMLVLYHSVEMILLCYTITSDTTISWVTDWCYYDITVLLWHYCGTMISLCYYDTTVLLWYHCVYMISLCL